MLYHYRLENDIESDNTLLREAYETMKQNKHQWLDSISWLYAKSGMANIYKNIRMFRKNHISHTISRKFTDIFIQENKAKLRDKEHFKDLINVIEHPIDKNKFYINRIKTPSIQKIFSKIRMNNTKLSTGPYQNIVKICNHCNVTNSIKHVLLECPSTNDIRTTYLNRMKDTCPWFHKLPGNEKMIRILNIDFSRTGFTEESSIINITISYVCDVYRIITKSA